MGIMAHVRETMPSDGKFIDKNLLVNSRIPFGIAAVRYEPTGTVRYPAPRWVSTITPWFQGHALPGLGPDEAGKISMNGNAMRDPMFQELSRMVQQAGRAVGPLILIQAVSKSGQRVFMFEDYSEAPYTPGYQAAAPAPAPAAAMQPIGQPQPAATNQPVGPFAAGPAAPPLPMGGSTAPLPAPAAPLVCAGCHETVTGPLELVPSVNRMGVAHVCRILGPIHVFS